MEHQNRDVGYNHLADNSGQAQLFRNSDSDQGTFTTSVLGTESYRLQKDDSSMNQACKGTTQGVDNLHPIKFDDYMNQPYKSCDQTIDCPQQARYHTSGLDSDYIRQKKDDDYVSNNPNILQQAGQGAVHAAQGAAQGASNMVHGAVAGATNLTHGAVAGAANITHGTANAVKNTLWANPDHSTTTTNAASNPSNPKF